MLQGVNHGNLVVSEGNFTDNTGTVSSGICGALELKGAQLNVTITKGAKFFSSSPILSGSTLFSTVADGYKKNITCISPSGNR